MTIVYILLAILILELLIFLHELGHFTAGKLLGFRILGFSLGFGPALFKFKKGETEYSLRAFPVGGLCQFDGEDEEALENDPRRFNAQPVWKRFIVILAGPFMIYSPPFLSRSCSISANRCRFTLLTLLRIMKFRSLLQLKKTVPQKRPD